MGHKLGAYHHLPHGITVPLVLDEVMIFNSAEVPNKMGTFPQYEPSTYIKKICRNCRSFKYWWSK